MTDCEKKFFDAIKEMIAPQYSIQPQINLASVIDKASHEKYRNELFRNVDFGIFDESYRLVVLIEINDQSHTQSDRRARDARVAAICEEAGVPLITFWTSYGVNERYIRGRLSQYLVLKSDENQEKSQESLKDIQCSVRVVDSVRAKNIDNNCVDEKNNIPIIDEELSTCEGDIDFQK